MGRQIQLSMLPADANALLRKIEDDGFTSVVAQFGESASVQPLSSLPEKSPGHFVLWNRQLVPTLQRKFIADAVVPHYRLDEFTEPVLEFSTSLLTEWERRPALTQGRIFGVFADKPIEFEKWYERIVRFVRKEWQRNPVAWLGGYIGPATSEWFESGGLLLPFFVPPVTTEWSRSLNEQHPTVG